MANTYNSNPIIINTVMGSSYKANGGLPINQPITITEIYWLNPVNIADTFVLTDNTGTVIRTGRCEVANQSQLFQFTPPKRVTDFTVGTVASGTLYITYY